MHLYTRKMSENNKVFVFKPKIIVLCFEGVVVDNHLENRYFEPYVSANISAYLSDHQNDREIGNIITNLRKQSLNDLTNGYTDCPEVLGNGLIGPESPEYYTPDVIQESVVQYINWQKNNQRLTPSGQRLQQLICRDGLASDRIKVKVYSDVMPALKLYKDNGIKLALLSQYDETTVRQLLPSADLLAAFDSIFCEVMPNKNETFDRIVTTPELEVNERWDVLYMTVNGSSAVCARNRPDPTLMVMQNEMKALLMVRDTGVKIRDYYLINFSTITSLLDIEFVVRDMDLFK